MIAFTTVKNRIPVFMVINYPINHIPLGLGMLKAYAQSYNNGALLEQYLFLPILNMPPTEATKIGSAFGPGVWLFSNYLWSSEHTLAVSKAVKNLSSLNITIHGGPSIPKYDKACREFMLDNSHVDIAVRGEGEITTALLLKHIARSWKEPFTWLNALESVEGISFCLPTENRQELVRTKDRPRASNINVFPSPYLTGIFDRFASNNHILASIIETNRGCPYACTYCDLGSLTQQKIRLFDLERIMTEIKWIARRKIPIFWIADANFGIFERDIEIGAYIAAAKKEHGYPHEVVMCYAKNPTKRIAQIVKILQSENITCQGVIAIQTTDQETLKIVRRSNIKRERYDELTEIFRQRSLPLATDLMIGLPGATVKSFKRDLEVYFDKDITVKAYRPRLLPNSPMADEDYIKRYEIEVDQSGYLISTYSYTRHDLEEMLKINRLYILCETYSFLRYILRYVKWEYKIPAVDYIQTLLDSINETPSGFSELIHSMFEKRSTFFKLLSGKIRTFYDEIADVSHALFGVDKDSAFDTVLRINQAVMPQPGRSFPLNLALDYDFLTYFSDHVKNERHSAPLAGYPPGELTITDPYNLSQQIDEAKRQYNTHQVFWELESPLRRRQSPPSFI